MSRLSSPVREVKEHYTVLVIGSGYGGAIAASRLARAGQRVCVLERGGEFRAGEFPDTEAEALAEVQAELPSGHSGLRTGLYEFYVNPDVNVFVGCGLGGTSLINANVATRPDARVFNDARWPHALREDPASLEEGYRRAEEMLRPVPYPARFPELPKLQALERSAEYLGSACSRVSIAVSFQEGVNHAGVLQHGCILCGDCVTGCNYGAKNTLAFNYLPDARNFGAEIYTHASVRRLERKDGRWLAHYQVVETGREEFDGAVRTVSADVVVLAAGTLGSTEILLRSKASGLPLSDAVGQQFSGNGDALGFSYGCAEEIRGVGYGHRDPRDMEAVGPSVTGMIDMRNQGDVEDGIVIHEIAAPGALSGLLPVALANAASALGRNTAEQAMATEESEIETLFVGPYETLANETQAYLVTTHEQRSGHMRLEDDRLRIEWPHAGDQPVFEKVNATLAEATRALGGNYSINPVWSTVFNRDLITVHPLGGCVLADDAEHGVVNHKGQAFSGGSGTAVYDGLYVCDGSTIPRSLGVGPLLTISALSERICGLLAQDRGWRIDYTAVAAPAAAVQRTPPRLRFMEKVRNDAIELDLTIVSENLDALMRDAEYKAQVAGNVVAVSISPHPLKVTKGEFSLPSRMYRMQLVSREGEAFHLTASRHNGALDLTIQQGDSQAGQVLLKSTLRLLPQDLQRQLSTLRVTNAANARERLTATRAFGSAFAGDLYEIYGGVADGRKKRPLRVNAPTVYGLPVGDGAGRLIRYEGGSRGPVLLAAGEGLSNLIFSIDTIETNLVEYLFAHSYDVWVLDAAGGSDREAAVAKVKEVTRAAGVRVLIADSDASVTADLNTATREAVPEFWRGLAILGKDSARDVYPGILSRMKGS